MLGRLDLRRAARERVRAVLEVRDAHRRVERVVLGEEQRRADVLEPVEDRELGGLQALRARQQDARHVRDRAALREEEHADQRAEAARARHEQRARLVLQERDEVLQLLRADLDAPHELLREHVLAVQHVRVERLLHLGHRQLLHLLLARQQRDGGDVDLLERRRRAAKEQLAVGWKQTICRIERHARLEHIAACAVRLDKA